MVRAEKDAGAKSNTTLPSLLSFLREADTRATNTLTTTYAHKFALKVKYRNIEQVVVQLDTNTISSHKYRHK